MSKAIDELMHEHRLIEKILGSLETFADAVERGAVVERRDVGNYVTFFREFADQCHHGKEEGLLFERMAEHGFPKEMGPLAVMYSDHEHGRAQVAALAAVASGQGPLTAAERRQIVQHARVYASHLREHIQKEDQVLYPMALQMLPDEVMLALAGEFEEFEKTVTGEGAHAKLHTLAESLMAAWPPAA